jgi:alkylated DNA nucleotide flippase Atl1
MAKIKETWREKLGSTARRQNLPRVEAVDSKMAERFGEGTLVIPSPVEVDALMKTVPKGKLMTINQIRAFMAQKYHTTYGCPMTTGIFVGMAAKAAEEEAQEGKAEYTPYWRTLKGKGELNEKYPGGIAAQAEKLEAEGHEIITDRTGKPKRVKGWEKKLVNV